MATSLGELLDTLSAAARHEVGAAEDAMVRADAGTALGHVGRALAHLCGDGISRQVGDLRERQVAALARTCGELAASAPLAYAGLTAHAAAAADAAAALRRHTRAENRWAAATAFIDVVGPLCELIEPGVAGPPNVARLAAARRHSLHAEQSAALHPPARADAAVLDWPIPSPVPDPYGDASTRIRESMAALAFTTRTATATLTVADVLAVTFAAQSLSTAAQPTRPQSSTVRSAYPQASAADAWQAVRATLTPFTDGSRYFHAYMPPVVRAARGLYDLVHPLERDPARPSGPVHEAIVEATQHLPALADDLRRRAVGWTQTGGLLAYACDLPLREGTLAQRLAGHRRDGVIRADAVDLRPVTDALHNAGLLSTALAGQSPPAATSTFPRRAWAAHQAVLDAPHTPAAISQAKQHAYRHLHAAGQQPAPRRGR